MWSDFVNEEIRWNTRDKTSSKGEDEEKFSLVVKENKRKAKKSQSKSDSSQGGKKKDFPKLNASIFMNSSSMRGSVHTIREESGTWIVVPHSTLCEIEILLRTWRKNDCRRTYIWGMMEGTA